MKQWMLLLALFAWMGGTAAKNVAPGSTYLSPDRQISLELSQREGRTFFKVMRNENLVLDWSLLGIESSSGSFHYDMALAGKIKSRVKTLSYELPTGKRSEVKMKYREVIVPLKNLQSGKMNLIFRISNDGVAYRYVLKGRGTARVTREYGAFSLPQGSTGFLQPLSVAHSGWARTNPSYEEHYSCDLPVGAPSTLGKGWIYPALFQVAGHSWVLISETGTTGTYCGTHLAHASADSSYRIEFPHPEEGLPEQHAYAEMKLPFETPWRTMVIGATPADVANTTMATDLVEPLYKPKFDYKTGKASWSWLVLKDDSVTYDVTRDFIDLADHLDLEYCLVDAPWDVQIGRERIATLSKYAQSRGVSLLLWYNSNGNWNDAPQTPKNCMNTREARRAEMAWMQSIGVKGIKVDFFGGDKQFYMQYYQDILTDANDFGLTVNFHGTTLPRGWERMFPNFVTNESVKGMEFVTFGQADADKQAEHCATLPFVRNVVGPMDFTPVVLNSRLGPNRKSGPERRTTAGFELALPVVFFSGVQHLGVIPENLQQFPSFVTDYLRLVPATWDETRFLSGYPGKDCVVARRSGATWYVAGINGENKAKTLSFSLKETVGEKRTGVLLNDATGAMNQVESAAVNSSGNVSVNLEPRGGFVMIFTGMVQMK